MHGSSSDVRDDFSRFSCISRGLVGFDLWSVNRSPRWVIPGARGLLKCSSRKVSQSLIKPILSPSALLTTPVARSGSWFL